MGLDMFLYKRTYVKNWSHQPQEEHHRIRIERGGKRRTDIKAERIVSIVEEVAYWRKANAVHRWFVAHVQNGADDCKLYPVSRDQLDELMRTCTEVLAKSVLIPGQVKNGYTFKDGAETPILEAGRVIADPRTAMALMPTQAGFFFGGTDYDEYYYQDLEDTVRQLQAVLAGPDAGESDFQYQSSW